MQARKIRVARCTQYMKHEFVLKHKYCRSQKDGLAVQPLQFIYIYIRHITLVITSTLNSSFQIVYEISGSSRIFKKGFALSNRSLPVKSMPVYDQSLIQPQCSYYRYSVGNLKRLGSYELIGGSRVGIVLRPSLTFIW